MAAFKCKMCGGDLVIEAGSSVCECEYCGSKQTVPSADNEKKMTLFARAGRLLRACDFDKAAGIFESLVADFPEEAEAYWGLVLCRFGIEYVDDPATGKKVPTCHRSGFDSVMDDENFDQACENADGIARRLYREEAKAIEELRKGIIEVSGKEAPYDVFISYKETDDSGERTEDSVIAQDIYDALTDKGYRVFFSRITLEDKLGTEYEPYIFAALHSAKVMLVVGTDYDHMNAVWVKNEWSRYLKLMASDRSKTLIPVYKNMDAYDMPKEFSKLTAQNMGKVGAMQDLLRGVRKLLGGKQEETSAPAKQETVVVQQAVGSTVASLLERMFMFLEDGKWQDANAYAEKVLDIEPKNAEAFIGKLMASERVRVRSSLKDCASPIEHNENYKKAVRFGSKEQIVELEGYNTHVITRNKNATYSKAQAMMAAADSEQEFKAAAKKFEEISAWKDADAKAAECLEQAETARKNAIYDAALAEMESAKTENEYKAAAEGFKKIPTWKDADTKVTECLDLAENARDGKLYDDACAVMEKNTISDYRAAIEQFKIISDHKDSVSKIEECKQAIAAIEANAKAERLAVEAKAKKTKKFVAIVVVVAILVSAVASIFKFVILPRKNYNEAMALKESGDVVAAAIAFGKAGNYEDAREQSFALWSRISGGIDAGYSHTVAIRENGTVVAVGNNDEGQCNVGAWSDIVAVAGGYGNTVGLRSDGTVEAVGEDDDSQCRWAEQWTDIVAVECEGWLANTYTVGLTREGKVIDTSMRSRVISSKVVAVSCGHYHTVGLCSDGTVVSGGKNSSGQCDVENWTNIIAIAAGSEHTVGLRSDGTVVAVGNNKWGQCKVSGWKDIVAIAAYGQHTVGLCSDGTVVAVGRGEYGQCGVGFWEDIVAIAAGAYHTVGLRADGTVVAVGSNDDGECNVGNWTDIAITIK